MSTFNEAITEFDTYTRQQTGIMDLTIAQQAINYLCDQVLRPRGASGVGFDILSTLVTQLNVFGTRLDQDIGEIKQVISTAEGPEPIGVKVDCLTSVPCNVNTKSGPRRNQAADILRQRHSEY
jgi:hypothetical protein